LGGLEPLATGLVPAQAVLAFLYPVFHLAPTVVYFNHLASRKPGVVDHKAYVGEQLALVSLDLNCQPVGFSPALRLIPQIHDFDLNPALGGTAHGAAKGGLNKTHQIPLGRQPDEISEVFIFAILVDSRVGKGSIAPKS
jgi:hypothetical protein